ncbi:MAG: hypothetical protein IJ510_00830 [Selenomonadales bacterium]|nr:hypothetical protein [Selenomonadales bacterium]
MTQDTSLASERLALLGERDALIKQQQIIQESLSAQSDALTAFCRKMTTLLLTAETRIAEKTAEIDSLSAALRQAQADNKHRQTELTALRRELTALKKTASAPPAEETDSTAKRTKSLHRAMQKQRKDQFAHQHCLEARLEELTAQLTAKDEQIRSLQAKWEESQMRCLVLMERERVLQDELLRLRPAPQLPEQDEPASDETADIPSADPIITELNRLAQTLTVSVIGGSPTWQKKASAAFPSLRFLGNQDFDSAKLLTTDILLVNTNHVSHACTKKAVDLAAARQTEVCYTSKHNLSQIAALLCDRIKSILS